MTLDPVLTPDQVADIYGRLRRRMLPGPAPRSLSAKLYRLAQYIGPHLQAYNDFPSRVSRRGRPLSPGPTGLAWFVQPAAGHTWQSLRSDWNSRAQEMGTSWTYDSQNQRNFIRDA